MLLLWYEYKYGSKFYDAQAHQTSNPTISYVLGFYRESFPAYTGIYILLLLVHIHIVFETSHHAKRTESVHFIG